MKKTIAILGIIVLLLGVFVGCHGIPESKQLIIVNDTDSAIEYISIRVNPVDEDARLLAPNALGDKTIAAGERMAFQICPYCVEVRIEIENSASVEATKHFSFDYLVGGVNQDITVTFSIEITEGEITLEGSNATETEID